MSTPAAGLPDEATITTPQIPSFSTVKRDVIVIGQTISGLLSALELSKRGHKVTIIGEPTPPTVSVGINHSERDWPPHAVDTLNAGHLLNDPRQVAYLTQNSGTAIDKMEQYGCSINTNEHGDRVPKQVDGHRAPRTFFSQSNTAQNLFQNLQRECNESSVIVEEDFIPTSLVSNGDRVGGVFGLSQPSHSNRLISSPVVIIAEGDYTGLFSDSGGTGAALTLSVTEGAFLREMEFVVFDGDTPLYTLGGLAINPETGEASLRGLFAVGDASGGWHGAGSLPGNRLLVDILSSTLVVDSIHMNQFEGLSKLEMETIVNEHIQGLQQLWKMNGPSSPVDLLNKLRELTNQYLQMNRSGPTLEEGLDKITTLREQCVELGLSDSLEDEEISAVLKLQNLLITSEMVFRTALQRKESRAHHQRIDYEETLSQEDTTYLVGLDSLGGVTITPHPLPELPKAIKEGFER